MKEIKPNQALNLYGILDNELSRMHELMRIYLSLPPSGVEPRCVPYGSNSTPSLPFPAIYKRITEMQDIVLKALSTHDETIQEKIAEMALTGEE